MRHLPVVATIIGLAVVAPAMTRASDCECFDKRLTVDLAADHSPDAASAATTTISLDEAAWEVVFSVTNVRGLNNGHVLAASVNTQALLAAQEFAPLVSPSANMTRDLWHPDVCGLGPVDTPAPSLGISGTWDNSACRATYTTRLSLVNPDANPDAPCSVQEIHAGSTESQQGAELRVSCRMILTTVRPLSATTTHGFVAHESAFTGEITLGTELDTQIRTVLHATLAKCSVLNGPVFAVECRIPGIWWFTPSTIAVSQSPSTWIDASSCTSEQSVTTSSTSASTFIRCNLNSSAPVADVVTATANISAVPMGVMDPVTFDVQYMVPRRVTTTTSASLAPFVRSVALADDSRFFYGTNDKATVLIDVVDVSRLTVTGVGLFNADPSGRKTLDMMTDGAFRTTIASPQSSNRFVIGFYPAAIRGRSDFYRYGPHGVDISMTFTAARRSSEDGTGNVAVEGILLEDPDQVTSGSPAGSPPSPSDSTGKVAIPIAVAAGGFILAAGIVGVAVVIVRRRRWMSEEDLHESKKMVEV